MAFYRVTRTDAVGDNEFSEAVVRASGRLQARRAITAALGAEGDQPFPGVDPAGANLRVARIADGKGDGPEALVVAYAG